MRIGSIERQGRQCSLKILTGCTTDRAGVERQNDASWLIEALHAPFCDTKRMLGSA